MRKFIEEYGLAILYTIIGAICLGFFAMVFIGDDTEVSKVIGNVVNNSTNQNLEVQYNISYNLNGGYFRVLKDQNGTPLEVKPGVKSSGDYYLISSFDEIISEPLVDSETNAKYYNLSGGEKLWKTYTRAKSFALPHAYDKTEIIDGKTYNKLLFDGWTGSGLATKTRNAVITKGSTGNRVYDANWTRGYYRIVFNNNIDHMKKLNDTEKGLNYLAVTTSGYDMNAWMSGNTPNKVVEYGSYATQELLIPKNEYQFLGHKFKYWHSDPVGKNGEIYRELTTLTKDLKEYDDTYNKDTQQTIVLYAQWEIVPYKINYTTTDLETSSNDNPTTYTIIDEFTLKTTTKDDYVTVTWYTVNPYVEDVLERPKHQFGTYSWKGDAYTPNHAPLYEFEHYNMKDGQTSIEKEQDGARAVGKFKNQTISYGTYGDLNLFGYKTTGINVYESHLTWIEDPKKPGEIISIDTKWKPIESEEKILREKVGFEWAMEEKEIQALLETKNLYAELKTMGSKVPGYRFEGLETSDGVLVFKADDIKQDLVATNEINFWTLEPDGEGNTIKTWAYGKNLDLYVKWKPIKYLVNLHSNY